MPRYNAAMTEPVTYAKVSHRGQTCLPAELRHRWGIETGGAVAFVDLGEAALVLPGGADEAKAELKRVLADRYRAGLELIEDPDLADQ
jgi:bifunctional DNA-binding transcriptional regulator/antitoxin component of YhaV-PrlF toxin-antitoxin module